MNLLDEMRQEPWRFGFFQSVRRINCSFPDKALTGTAFHPAEDPVRFGQSPHTSFAPATLSEVDLSGEAEVARITQFFMGLFGPNGPLPLHLTEFVRDRLRHNHDPTLARFADMFHHRMVSLFYRAWAQSQPTVQQDRPGEDRFSVYVGSLAGFGTTALQSADTMPQASKLHFAGHLGSLPRHVEGLAAMIQSLFQVPTRIVEFVAHWLTIPRRDRFVLGSRLSIGTLGESSILGERVWQRQDKFRVELGPLSLQEYEDFLPSGSAYRRLVDAVRNYLGLELLWEIKLQLKGSDKPVTCLGKQGRLGWTSWLQTERPRDVVTDLMLQTANYPQTAERRN